MKAVKRILTKDMRAIEEQQLNSLGIYIHFNEENILEANAMIVGAKDSLYEGGFLFFKIKFPKNYPFSPPDVVYISRNRVRIHPNLYVSSGTGGYGKVCLSILGTWSGPKWTTIMDISTVLLSLQSLLDSNPLCHEPGSISKNTKINTMYNEVIQYETFKTLLLKNCKDVPSGFEVFKNDMKHEFELSNEILSKKLSTIKKVNKLYNIPFYRIQVNVDYNIVHSEFEDFKNKIHEYLKI